MTLSSTSILIMARTGQSQQFGVPCRLRRDFSPYRLQSAIVWIMALLMTAEWTIDKMEEATVNGLFFIVMVAIFTCAGIVYIEDLCESSKMWQR